MPTLRIRPAFMVSPTADHLSDARLVQGRLRSPEQVHRVLQIPRLPSCDSPPCNTDGAEAEGTEIPSDAVYHRDVDLPVPHQASASYGLGSRLELGLDQQDRLPQRGSGREEAFERDRKRDEREVGHQKVGVERQIFCCQPAHVGPLHNDHAWIVTQRPVELAITYVDGEHPLGSSLQECVGKPSCRCSGIETGTSLHPHAKLVDGGVQFLAGPRHKAFGLVDRQRLISAEARACFGHYHISHAHAAREDQTLSSAPARGEAPLDEQRIQSPGAPFRATLHESRLTLPVAHEIRQLLETRGVSVDFGERSDGPLCGPVSLPFCAFEAEDASERGLALLGVGTRALAELLSRRSGVEDVVDYLEAEAELRSVLRDGGLFLAGSPCQYRPDTGRGFDQGARLVLVDHVQGLGVGRLGASSLVHVHNLPPDHPVDPCGACQLPHDLENLLAAPLLVDRDQGQGLAEEGIACEYGHRLAELPVGGRPSPPVVVIVHSWKVVVDKGVSVDEFDGGRGWEHVGGFGPEDPGRLHAKSRPHALAAGEHGVPHGPFESSEPCLRCEPEALQVVLEGLPVPFPPDLAVRRASPARHAQPCPAFLAQRLSEHLPRRTALHRRRIPWRARRPRLPRPREGRHPRRASRRAPGGGSNGPPRSCGAPATPRRRRRAPRRAVVAPLLHRGRALWHTPRCPPCTPASALWSGREGCRLRRSGTGSETPACGPSGGSRASPLHRSSDPRQVLVGASVYPHPIARVDKERHLYDDPCLQGCRFGPPCRRVAFEAWISLRNPEVDVRRRLYADNLTVGR